RYLGVILQADGGFGQQVSALLAAGKRRLGLLKHYALRRDLPTGMGRALIMTCMLPLLEQGVPAWSCRPPMSLVGQLDHLWFRAGRAVVGVPQYASVEVVFGDLGLQPLRVRRALI